MTTEATVVRDWLVYDGRSECWWGPNRGGYWKSLHCAGLYTEQEAKAIEDFSDRYGRQDKAVPLSSLRESVDRLHAALYPSAASIVALLRESVDENHGYDDAGDPCPKWNYISQEDRDAATCTCGRDEWAERVRLALEGVGQ